VLTISKKISNMLLNKLDNLPIWKHFRCHSHSQ